MYKTICIPIYELQYFLHGLPIYYAAKIKFGLLFWTKRAFESCGNWVPDDVHKILSIQRKAEKKVETTIAEWNLYGMRKTIRWVRAWPYRFVQWRSALPTVPNHQCYSFYNTSVCFVRLRWDMVSSENPKWALTSSGGVKASHWVSEISSKRFVFKISRNFKVVFPVFSM